MSGRQKLPDKPLYTLSHSSLSSWQECRRKYELKYIERLEPSTWPEESEALEYGKLFDVSIGRWLWGQHPEDVLLELDEQTLSRHWDPRMLDRFIRARAMLKAYFERYSERPGRIVGVQVELQGPIENPATGAASKLADFLAILDGLFLDDQGRLWIYELKTASRLDGAYLEALWMSPQTGLYALYLGRAGFEVAGVLYDLCQKVPWQTKRREGESEGAYEQRAAELKAMNKNGKTSAKRQLPETWDDFGDRLLEDYRAHSGERFLRQEILIDQRRLADVEGELWRKAQDLITARQRGLFYRNDRACRGWGRDCEFLPICQAGADQGSIIENLYRRKAERKPVQITDERHNAGSEQRALVNAFGTAGAAEPF